MPALKKPVAPYETAVLPAAQATLAVTTDVLVVGAGPAGMAAAVGAARSGASVVLADENGFLGGSATVALVNPMVSFFTHGGSEAAKTEREPLLFPRDHGEGMPVIGGVFRDFLELLFGRAGCLLPSSATGYTTPFDPELYKLAAMDLIDNAGVRVLLHASAFVTASGKDMNDVFFHTKSGAVAIRAKIVCDCTGNGDIAAAAGASFEIGRDDGLTQPATLHFRIGGFSPERFKKYVEKHPDDWTGVSGLQRLMKQAADHENSSFPREDMLFFGSTYEDEVYVNSTRISGVLGTDVFDLTRAEWEGRRQTETVFAFLKKHVPGFEHARLVQTGATICIRETRRITGRYMLSEHDLLSAQRFEDAVAQGAYPIDVHDPDGKGTALQHIPAGKAYQIPLRSLIPVNLNWLVMAGRCISGTHLAHASYRVMPVAFATGHAAGVCAALAATCGLPVDSVPAGKVRAVLRSQGALLDTSAYVDIAATAVS